MSAEGRERQRLSAAIDELVEGEMTDELLGRLVKQALGLRYFDATHERLNDLILRALDARMRQLIADYIKEWDDTLWEAVKTRLEDVHLGALGVAITDSFMDDLAKGKL